VSPEFSAPQSLRLLSSILRTAIPASRVFCMNVTNMALVNFIAVTQQESQVVAPNRPHGTDRPIRSPSSRQRLAGNGVMMQTPFPSLTHREFHTFSSPRVAFLLEKLVAQFRWCAGYLRVGRRLNTALSKSLCASRFLQLTICFCSLGRRSLLTKWIPSTLISKFFDMN
jgi:hypothetical protein